MRARRSFGCPLGLLFAVAVLSACDRRPNPRAPNAPQPTVSAATQPSAAVPAKGPPPTVLTPPMKAPPPRAECAAPKVAQGAACCWPGQSVSDNRCVGVPQCPEGLRPSGEDCVARVAPSALISIPRGSVDMFGVKHAIAPFQLEARVVTVAQFTSVQPKLYGAKRTALGCNAAQLRDDAPMNCVTYDEAASYCKQIGRRLPTAPELARALSHAGETAATSQIDPGTPELATWTSTDRKCWKPPCEAPRREPTIDIRFVCHPASTTQQQCESAPLEWEGDYYLASNVVTHGIRCAQ